MYLILGLYMGTPNHSYIRIGKSMKKWTFDLQIFLIVSEDTPFNKEYLIYVNLIKELRILHFI